MKNLFNHTWVLGILQAISIYFTKFNDLSETELVRWSYVWLPLIIIGVVGQLVQKNGIAAGLANPFNQALISAAKWTVVGMALLIIFYETIWNDL